MADKGENIDKFFRDHLTGHKVSAPVGAWNRMQSNLHPRKRKAAYFYVKLAAASLVLLLVFETGYLLSEFGSDKTSLTASKTETVDHSALEATKPSLKSNEEFREIAGQDIWDASHRLPAENSTEEANQVALPAISDMESDQQPDQKILVSVDQDNVKSPATMTENNFESTAKENRDGEILEGIEEVSVVNEETAVLVIDEGNQNEIAEEQIEAATTGQAVTEVPPANDGIDDELKNMTPEELHKLLVGTDDFDDETFTDNQPKSKTGWSVGGQLSPTYSYRRLSGDAFQTPDENVDQSYFNNTEKGLASMGGGVSLAYNFNDRLSLGSGLYLSRIGQENDDVVAYDSPDSQYMYKLATSSGTILINPTKFDEVLIKQIDSPKDSIPGEYLVNGTFVQNLDYLEVPLVLNYKVLNKRFLIKLSGGISPGILVNNCSYFNLDGDKIQTGYTENVKPMIYNSMLGLGIGYDISAKISINLSPTFKYSLSPVNSGSALNYHPYTISLFTGISYKL